MKLSALGWTLSLACLALWPIVLLPGIMSLASTHMGLWATCTHSWFGAFICTTVGYPLLLAVLGGVLRPVARKWLPRAVPVLGWIPLALLVLTAVPVFSS